ncbi:MAG: glycoside hydrolase family 16 protein [Verrucomicrobiota bacterium]|jgi:beta-glucanase (GH16 family)|nr:glycoside hydrolase family 16 protein [Verrucomicrobiota bacterium]
MKQTTRFLAPMILSTLFALPLHAADWQLVWSDEFDRPGLANPEKWNYEEGFIRNREAQYYTKARLENAEVEDGRLVIQAIKEDFKTAKYTSASLHTWGKAAWTYGRIEVRAKLPQGRGVWPAIWTLGTNRREVGWPACGEIDIMEFVGFDPNTVHVNVHTRDLNHNKGNNRGAKHKVERPPFEDFHVYALEWFEDRMEFYFDETKIFTFTKEPGGEGTWPFDKPQYLILNLAIGGAWGGQQGIDDTIFPQRYEIDYVRVYQENPKKSE